MQKSAQHWTRVLPSLLIPIFVGLSMYLVILAMLESGQISNDVVLRYLTGHPVSKITTAMFCVGLASLGLMAWDVMVQSISLDRIVQAIESPPTVVDADDAAAVTTTGEPSDGEDLDADSPADQAAGLLRRLQDQGSRWQHHHLYQRLQRLLNFVARGDDAGAWDDEAKYLSEMDQEKMGHRYSLVRILIWATPMLGFLGTVLGISQALGGIQVGPDNDFQQMMDALRSSLYVAFDTTALALTLSMLLMFFLFLVERFELQLLMAVDERVVAAMADRFKHSAARGADRDLQQIQRTVMANSHQLVQHQAELWRETIRAAQEAWKSSLEESNAAVQEGLRAAVVHAVRDLQRQIGRNIERADTALTHRWEQWQVLLSENARKFSLNQTEMIRQTEVLGEAIGSLRDIHERLMALQRPGQTLQATERLQQTLDRLVKTIEWLGVQSPGRATRASGVANEANVWDSSQPDSKQTGMRARDSYFVRQAASTYRQKKAG